MVTITMLPNFAHRHSAGRLGLKQTYGSRQPAGAMRRPPKGDVVFAEGDVEFFLRPCVDCGTVTDCFCENCYAAERLPFGDNHGRGWAPGQLTPLCRKCDASRKRCHYCLALWVLRPVPAYCTASRVRR